MVLGEITLFLQRSSERCSLCSSLVPSFSLPFSPLFALIDSTSTKCAQEREREEREREREREREGEIERESTAADEEEGKSVVPEGKVLGPG